MEFMRYERRDRSPRREKPDWLFTSDRLGGDRRGLVKAQPQTQLTQLQRYAKTLRRLAEFNSLPAKGILVLTREPLSEWQLSLGALSDLFLGEVFWRDIMITFAVVR